MSEVVPSTHSHKKGFFTLFPTPGFLHISRVGIALSDRAVHLVEFRQTGHRGDLTLLTAVEVRLAPGLIVAGYIHDKEALSKVLSDLRIKYGFDFARATLPEEKAYVFTTQVDKKPFDSLRDRVAFTIEENVPVALSESVFDFDIIGDTEDKALVKVAVAVLPNKAVEVYLKIFEDAGITPISFDIESQAIARAVILTGDTRAHLILNLSEDKTGFYIAEDEVMQFSSTPAYGTRQDDSGGYPDLSNLKTEMRKLFVFWNTRLNKMGIPQKKIEKIILTGVGANKKNEGFLSDLMEGIDVEYSVANVWANAFSFNEYLPDISFEESLSYGAAIGTALPNKEPKYV
ncbi:MAG: hypothetical protein AB200_02110 [Parcubacteria bacterium C7867-005]|nr:MAG: hypothetical protein AB200_02110 [Parcubacteria bacterium C7867-005]